MESRVGSPEPRGGDHLHLTLHKGDQMLHTKISSAEGTFTARAARGSASLRHRGRGARRAWAW